MEELGLESEAVTIREERGAPSPSGLRINGATPEEIDFLLGGERVELNAMPSDQFIAFVERKLTANGVAKVIPSAETLAETFATFKRGAMAEKALKAELERLNAKPVRTPANLEAQVRAYLAENPADTWDKAVRAIVGRRLVRNEGRRTAEIEQARKPIPERDFLPLRLARRTLCAVNRSRARIGGRRSGSRIARLSPSAQQGPCSQPCLASIQRAARLVVTGRSGFKLQHAPL